MMEIPNELSYSKDHEWVKIEGNIATIGITYHASDSLGDVVYVDVITSRDNLNQFDKFGEIESVKAVSDLYLPLGGKIMEINEDLNNNPQYINDDCYNKGWIIKLEVNNLDEMKNLLNAEEYKKNLE
jgi:glycine cleavage system H protein